MTSCHLIRSGLRIVLVSALSCTLLPAQNPPAPAPPAGGGQQGGGQTGAGNPGAGRPGGQQPGQQQPGQQPGQMPGRNQQDPFSEMQNRPVFLSGKVIMDDGTPPPDSVVIERVCGSVVRPEAHTDSKGRFSFQLGQNQAMMADASMSSIGDPIGAAPGRGGGMMGPSGRGISERDLMGCELRANLAGFRSEPVNLSGRRALDNPDVGTIILHRLAKVEGFTFSATSAYAPKDAKKAFEKGSEAAKKKKWADAETNFQKAVDTYPKYAAAWYELGLVHQQQQKLEEAKKAYQGSIQADGKFVTPYAQLARIAGAEQKWPEVAEYTSKVIKLNPYFSPDIYYISAVANFNLQKFDAAEEDAREALKLDAQKKNPRANHLLGLILAQKEKYPEAAENMRTFLKRVPEGPDAENVKKQLAEVERRMGASSTAQGQKPTP
ncbi:MAG TPA: tetratricopeptide repeat protein [Bryobacteraceae bacterium]|nr:tetratricopeptide repeat protein [Bryobacteraceae bacterium]